MNARSTHTTEPSQLREDLERFERNSEFAEQNRDRFLEEHRGEWLIVFDDQQVRLGRNIQDLVSRVPVEHRNTAVLLFLEDAPAQLIL